MVANGSSPQAAEAMTAAWFDLQGLVSLAALHNALNKTGNCHAAVS
ncbi:hypothetical protein SAMN05518849_11217 [Sphingobium sp. AP50]|nr:hypothetical protein SAMN05518849_11217 [Sphingobium sp. AP50]